MKILTVQPGVVVHTSNLSILGGYSRKMAAVTYSGLLARHLQKITPEKTPGGVIYYDSTGFKRQYLKNSE